MRSRCRHPIRLRCSHRKKRRSVPPWQRHDIGRGHPPQPDLRPADTCVKQALELPRDFSPSRRWWRRRCRPRAAPPCRCCRLEGRGRSSSRHRGNSRRHEGSLGGMTGIAEEEGREGLAPPGKRGREEPACAWEEGRGRSRRAAFESRRVGAASVVLPVRNEEGRGRG